MLSCLLLFCWWFLFHRISRDGRHTVPKIFSSSLRRRRYCIQGQRKLISTTSQHSIESINFTRCTRVTAAARVSLKLAAAPGKKSIDLSEGAFVGSRRRESSSGMSCHWRDFQIKSLSSNHSFHNLLDKLREIISILGGLQTFIAPKRTSKVNKHDCERARPPPSDEFRCHLGTALAVTTSPVLRSYCS